VLKHPLVWVRKPTGAKAFCSSKQKPYFLLVRYEIPAYYKCHPELKGLLHWQLMPWRALHNWPVPDFPLSPWNIEPCHHLSSRLSEARQFTFLGSRWRLNICTFNLAAWQLFCIRLSEDICLGNTTLPMQYQQVFNIIRMTRPLGNRSFANNGLQKPLALR
jgi:hypothetical protein